MRLLKAQPRTLWFGLALLSVSTAFGQQAPPRTTSSSTPLTQNPQTSRSAATLGTPQFAPPQGGVSGGTGGEAFAPNQPGIQSPAAPVAPPFPALTVQQQERLGVLLDYWEKKSSEVKTYKCRFTRYEYNPAFGPPTDPYIVDEGSIRFAAPDKGEFNVERRGKWAPPKAPGERPQYPMQNVSFLEHWICDGKSVYELDGSQKQLIERVLPAEMQGMQIADGPLPFMFGASRKKIEARYWVREVEPPKGRTGEIWLEVYPRNADDAASFQKLVVILAQDRFLPVGLCVYPPAFDAKKNPAKTTYMLSEMQINKPEDRGLNFIKKFISPNVPKDWKKVVENFPVTDDGTTPRAAALPKK